MAFVFPDVVNGANVWMIERGGRSGLLKESSKGLRVFRERLREKLDGDLPPESPIFCPVDDPHPTLAEQVEDAVVRNRPPLESRLHQTEATSWRRALITATSSASHYKGDRIKEYCGRALDILPHQEEADADMPFKSQAQRRKFAELLVQGKISPDTFEEWNRETGSAKLPERVKGKTKTSRKRKTTQKRKPARTARAKSRRRSG